MSNIDVETLMNDKKLLREELQEWKDKYQALWEMYEFMKIELGNVYDQRSDLTDEVMRLSAIVERNGYVDDGR